MDEQLQQLFRLQPFLENVILYRTNKDIQKVIKTGYMAELKNLLEVDMDIVQLQVKMPEPNMLAPISEPKLALDPDSVLVEYWNTMNALSLL